MHVTTTSFLGLVISPGRIEMNPEKVQAVASWPTPPIVKSFSLTSGCHPQSNGMTERLNQVLETGLHLLCHHQLALWARNLVWVEYTHNSLPSGSTGISPFHCVHGFQVPLFEFESWRPRPCSGDVDGRGSGRARNSSKQQPSTRSTLTVTTFRVPPTGQGPECGSPPGTSVSRVPHASYYSYPLAVSCLKNY